MLSYTTLLLQLLLVFERNRGEEPLLKIEDSFPVGKCDQPTSEGDIVTWWAAGNLENGGSQNMFLCKLWVWVVSLCSDERYKNHTQQSTIAGFTKPTSFVFPLGRSLPPAGKGSVGPCEGSVGPCEGSVGPCEG